MLSRISMSGARTLSNAYAKQAATTKASQGRGQSDGLIQQVKQELKILDQMSPKNRYCEEYTNFARQFITEKK